MINLGTKTGTHYDFTTVSAGGEPTGIPQSVINIIEANTGSQTNVFIAEVDMIEIDGKLVQVKKYGDTAKTILVMETNITWTGSVPTVVTAINYDDGKTKTTTLTWYNGKLTNVSHVLT